MLTFHSQLEDGIEFLGDHTMRRVAILGFGSSGQRFASLVTDYDQESEILVYSLRDLRISDVRTTSDLGEIASFQPDVAIICGAASLRALMVSAVPVGTKAILIEKPLAASAREAVEIMALLRNRDTVCQIGYNLRFSTSLNEFRRLVDANDLGSVVGVRATTGQYLPDWRPNRDYRETVSARKDMGGGVLRELSHEFDYIQWIFGEIQWVSAFIGKQSSLEIDVEDTAHVTCGVEPTGSADELVVQINLDFLRRDQTRTIVAICEHGTLRWDGIARTVERWHRGATGWEIVFEESDADPTSYELQCSSLLSSVDTRSVGGATPSEGLSVLRVVEAVEKSSLVAGRRVDVEKSA